MTSAHTGSFYAFEGINGSGKTTVLHEVAKRLRAKLGEDRVVTLCNPTNGPIGQEARRFFATSREAGLPPFFGQGEDTMLFARRLALLFMADRHMLQANIHANLDDGRIVLCDRYSLSTLVYQCAIVGDVAMRGELADFICAGHFGIEEPERTFLFDLPVDVARARLAVRGERLDDRIMADIDPVARQMYVDYHRADTSSRSTGALYLPGTANTALVDANREIGDVAASITATILSNPF